jgi:hypothetical protein
MVDKKWIQELDIKKGAFSRQAKREGLTTKQFEDKVIKSYKSKGGYNPTLTTYRRALLSRKLRKIKKKK